VKNTAERHLFQSLSVKNHPLRQKLTEEMHVRVFPAFSAPARLCQILTLTAEEGEEADREHAEALCRRHGVTPPTNSRYFSVAFDGYMFVWERHTEFSTWTFIEEHVSGEPFTKSVLTHLPEGWLDDLPGQVLRGTRIEVLSNDQGEPGEGLLSRLFSPADLVVCDVSEGEARVWSDFRLHADGFGRLLVQDRGLAEGDTARLVQRLQELGNYRMMSLLGLPLAQGKTPRVTELEQRLALLSKDIAEARDREDALLEALSELSAELSAISADTSYRMSATRAYSNLVSDRLEALKVGRVPGYQTLVDFTDRRLTPAVRTCESFSARLDNLSERAARASSLLRTRITTALERQNSELLASMNRRARMQLRLQETVEGLSIAAISYYAVGLIGYLAKAAKARDLPVDPTLITGASVPLVIVALWMMLRRLRAKVSGSSKE